MVTAGCRFTVWVEFFHGPVETQALQGQAGHFFGLVEQFPGLGIAVIQGLAHAEVWDPWPGKSMAIFFDIGTSQKN